MGTSMARLSREAIQASPEAAKENVQAVGFRIGDEEYAVEILTVVGVERLDNVLHFPRMPRFIEGVKRIRGEIVPLVGLRTRFGLSERPADAETRVIVVEIGEHTVGFIVDAVTKVRRFTWSDVESAPEPALTVESCFIDGVVRIDDRMIILLNPEMVLLDEETSQLPVVASDVETDNAQEGCGR